jgi:hypothetical protein
MVYEISDKKRVFLESLALTLMILIIGFSIGFSIEFNRTNNIIDSYTYNEIEALDLKLQNYYYQIMDGQDCNSAIEQNFIFADNLYIKGLDIEKYVESNQLTDDIVREQKRYSLLKTELWLNSILLKNKCREPFDTVVYMFSHDPDSSYIVNKQKVISNVLKSVKEKKGNNIILIPLAGDMDLGIVDLQKKIYNITELPSIIINEKTILSGYNSENEILKYLK